MAVIFLYNEACLHYGDLDRKNAAATIPSLSCSKHPLLWGSFLPLASEGHPKLKLYYSNSFRLTSMQLLFHLVLSFYGCRNVGTALLKCCFNKWLTLFCLHLLISLFDVIIIFSSAMPSMAFLLIISILVSPFLWCCLICQSIQCCKVCPFE